MVTLVFLFCKIIEGENKIDNTKLGFMPWSKLEIYSMREFGGLELIIHKICMSKLEVKNYYTNELEKDDIYGNQYNTLGIKENAIG